MAIVSLRGVSRTFQDQARAVTVLRDVDLEVQAGERVAIVGKSGSGKSTLLNLLTGIDHPSTGSVEVAGQALGGLSESALAAFRGRHIGIVFQFFQLIPTLTARENVLLAMELVNVVPVRDRAARASALLQQVGVEAQADRLPGSLSGGEQQRVAIARALANDPALIIADEPTGNLDHQTSANITALLKGLAAAGKTVIVVTHDMAAARSFERVISVRDGRLDLSGGQLA